MGRGLMVTEYCFEAGCIIYRGPGRSRSEDSNVFFLHKAAPPSPGFPRASAMSTGTSRLP